MRASEEVFLPGPVCMPELVSPRGTSRGRLRCTVGVAGGRGLRSAGLISLLRIHRRTIRGLFSPPSDERLIRLFKIGQEPVSSETVTAQSAGSASQSFEIGQRRHVAALVDDPQDHWRIVGCGDPREENNVLLIVDRPQARREEASVASAVGIGHDVFVIQSASPGNWTAIVFQPLIAPLGRCPMCSGGYHPGPDLARRDRPIGGARKRSSWFVPGAIVR